MECTCTVRPTTALAQCYIEDQKQTSLKDSVTVIVLYFVLQVVANKNKTTKSNDIYFSKKTKQKQKNRITLNVMKIKEADTL